MSPPLARLAFGPGTKATYCPGLKDNQDKWPETKAYSIVVVVGKREDLHANLAILHDKKMLSFNGNSHSHWPGIKLVLKGSRIPWLYKAVGVLGAWGRAQSSEVKA